MRNKVRFLIIAVVCIVTYAGCANHDCSVYLLKKVAIEELNQQLKKATIEEANDSLKSIAITTISWGDYAVSFLSEKVEIEERRVVFYGFIGQMDAEDFSIDWVLPMGAACPITAYLPMGADCCVCIDGECVPFPREVE